MLLSCAILSCRTYREQSSVFDVLEFSTMAGAVRGRPKTQPQKVLILAAGVALAACAGRDPHPVAVVQPQDAQSDCAMIRAEIEANNVQAEKLADENHAKIAQNVAAGVVGVVVWPVWFAMDAKGAAGTEMDALKARQQYLAALAEQRCPRSPGAAPLNQPSGKR
jgi:hypothetical protein